MTPSAHLSVVQRPADSCGDVLAGGLTASTRPRAPTGPTPRAGTTPSTSRSSRCRECTGSTPSGSTAAGTTCLQLSSRRRSALPKGPTSNRLESSGIDEEPGVLRMLREGVVDPQLGGLRRGDIRYQVVGDEDQDGTTEEQPGGIETGDRVARRLDEGQPARPIGRRPRLWSRAPIRLHHSPRKPIFGSVPSRCPHECQKTLCRRTRL